VICPYCREAIEAATALACDACATVVHVECAALHGGCTTFACPGSTFSTASARVSRRALAPQLPATLAARRAVREAVAVALAPRDALAWVGLAGLVAAAIEAAR
jgi:hypothetical protein